MAFIRVLTTNIGDTIINTNHIVSISRAGSQTCFILVGGHQLFVPDTLADISQQLADLEIKIHGMNVSAEYASNAR
jgi:hypothetical protein